MGRFVFATAVGVWLGTVVSFSFVMLPAIHAVLTERANTLLDALFPRYYTIGVLCGLTALAAVSLAPTTPLLPFSERVRLASPVVVGLLCTLVGQRVLLPRLQNSRGGSNEAAFARLHQVSAALNSTTLAVLVLAVAAVATR
jgi:xanthine/uracil permease